MVAADTPNLGITSKPQNLGVALTTQTTGSFRNFMVELQICNSPHQPQANFRLRSFLNHLRNHNDYSASAILRFALSSTSYRQLPPMGDCE